MAVCRNSKNSNVSFFFTSITKNVFLASLHNKILFSSRTKCVTERSDFKKEKKIPLDMILGLGDNKEYSVRPSFGFSSSRLNPKHHISVKKCSLNWLVFFLKL